MLMKGVRTAYGLLFIVIMFGCKSGKVNQTSSDRLYKKENIDLNAHYVIYHVNDSISQLFYNISNESLVYKKTDTSNYFYSDVKLMLKISSENQLDETLDTASVYIKDRQTEVKVRELKGSLLFKLKAGSNYYVEVNVYDVNKRIRYAQSLFAGKESKYTRQNFLVMDIHGEVLFNSYYKPEDVIYFKSDRNPEKEFKIDYFNPVFKLSPPPFSLDQMPHFSYKPEYSLTVNVKDGKTELVLPQKGFFHLKTNDESKEGVTFFVYESGFPKIKNSEQMILATRYIMAKKEFDNCMNASDKKEAIDKFWLDVSGSNERAKSLIKKYYARVQEANKVFTSYQEGWKTDRGMIYIVFGAPNRVTKRKNGELWTYGETGNPNSLVFSFVKIINPFTDNDYYLERSEILKMPWYQAVDMWRQGRIYLDN